MKTKLLLLIILSFVTGLSSAFAQEDLSKAQKAPQSNEVILNKSARTSKGYDSDQSAYKAALHEAKLAFPKKEVGIRSLTKGDVKVNGDGSISFYYNYIVVELPDYLSQCLNNAIKEATRQISKGNRFALDKLTTSDEQLDKERIKGVIINYLLEQGYKVVAKEHFEKLFKEQRGQQSGIYNAETTVEDNNFTAVGYFLNIRVTDNYIQVQVINVSTGEYESNVSLNI